MIATEENLNKKELLTSFDGTASELIELLSSFSQDELNRIPFDGSWTAGQLGEHLLKSGVGIARILKGNTLPTKRAADEKEKALKTIFLDFSQKFKAAQNVMPSDEPKEKEKLLYELKGKMNEIREVSATMDITLTCIDSPFPTLGELTRWEWISFVIYHTQRHTYQLNNIRKIFD